MLWTLNAWWKATGPGGNTNFMGPYNLTINGGSVVTAKSLSLTPVRLAVGNLVAGELELRWKYCGDAAGAVAACPLTKGDEVEFFDGETLLFAGVAAYPRVVASESGNTIICKVRDAFWRWSRRHFVRGSWWPSLRYPYGYTPGGPIPAPDFSNFLNSPVCQLYRGYRWVLTTLSGNSWDTRTIENQTLEQAIEEAVYFTQVWDERDGLTPIALGDVDFGPSGLKPEPAWQGPTDTLAWMVKIMQPQIDGWVRLRPVSGAMTLEAGRYRDQTAAEIPLRSWEIEEAAGNARSMLSAIYDDTDHTITAEYVWPGGEAAAHDDDVGIARWGDEGAVPVLYTDSPTEWYLGSSYDPEGLGQLVGESLLLSRYRGACQVDAEHWATVQPGSRLLIGGQSLDVQRATLDFGRQICAVQCGMPEALGLSDFDGLKSWVDANYRSLRSQITP